jgi:hypothetical protein
MKQPILQTLKSRLFALIVHLAIWVVVCLAAIGLTGTMPDVHEEEAFSAPPQDPVPVSKLGQLFSPDARPKSLATNTNLSAFYTRNFVPPAVQAAPAPTTRKFDLTYQGYYDAPDVSRQTIIKLGDAFIVSPVGGRVISNLFVANASYQALVLTNTTSQTNILLLNTKKEIEVPIQ